MVPDDPRGNIQGMFVVNRRIHEGDDLGKSVADIVCNLRISLVSVECQLHFDWYTGVLDSIDVFRRIC